MNKQQILQLTGLSEDQFYDQYPDQETFCNDYPEACSQLEQAQGGMQVGVTYDSSGNPVDISPDVTPSQWQTVDGMYTRPHTVDRFGNPIAPMTSVTRQPVDRVPFNRAQPMDVITPMIARYTLPKGMVDNTMPIEKFSAKQTMQQVGSIGKSYSAPVNKYQSIVDLLKSKGMDASFSSRKELAKQLGIDNYTGTATQNMTLLNLVADNSDQMKYGGIHIKKSNEGKFTEWAKAHHMGVQEAASHVMANKEDYSPTIVKRANFAKNAAGWKHEEGGIVDEYQKGGYVVKSGDTLSQIAAANKMSLGQLLSINPQFRSNPDLIRVGDRVMVGNGMVETPLQRSNREYAVIADNAIKANNAQRARLYPITATDSKSVPNSRREIVPKTHHISDFFNNISDKLSSYADYANTFVNDPTFRERVFGRFESEDPRSIKEVVIPTAKKANQPNQPIPFGYNQLGVVRDVKSTNPKDSLISYTYTGDNETGVPFVIGHMMANKTKDTFQNVHGVGHFLMDADVLPNQQHTEPYTARGNEYVVSAVPNKFINASTNDPETFNMFYKPTGRRPDEYYVAYEQNRNAKKYFDKGYEGDLSLRNVKFSDVDWEGVGKSTGYLSKSNWVPKKDGSQTAIPYKDKSGFSRFSGGSGIYLFKDPVTKKTIQSNISGSVSTIKKWGENIIDKYKIKPEELQLLYHDMGSYSAKPKAYNDDVLSYNQWSNFNTYNKGRSGAPLIIPKETGGDVFPAMRNFKKGGYYGMDQRFHPNSDSGTYVSGAGYYFQPGGTAVTSSTPPGQGAGVEIGATPGATGSLTNGGYNPDGSFAGDFGDESGFSNSSDPYSNQDQEFNDQQAPYDASQYSSEIDPSTGFTRYKKNNLVLKNIKKQDPALWQHLKEEGHGARWQTGQTDIQKFGRNAGAIGKGLENAINDAGAIGGYLANRKKQQSIDKAAMNMGSTASMFTNPEESSKGVVGDVGSSYGMFKPNKTGDFSYQGMVTGKYGMEVPKYAVGGFEPQLDVLENYKSIGPEQNTIVPFVESYNSPLVPVDNTRVAPPTVPLDVREQINNSNVKISNIPNPKGKDIATRLNNPGNIIYTPIFGKMFGAVDSGIKQTDGSGHFAAFPDVQTGLKARETQLFGNVDGIFQSRYYKPNTDIDSALKKWSGGGYGVNIYPALKGKTLAEITPQERKELMKRQIKQESGSMYRYLQSIGTFKDGGQQNGGQVVEMDENEIKQFLAAGGQLEFLD